MVRKKRVKKVGKNVHKKRKSLVKFSSSKNKIKLVFNKFLLFVGLTIVSLIFFNLVSNTILINLFQIMIIAFGFISVSLLISLLILMIVKAVKKNK